MAAEAAVVAGSVLGTAAPFISTLVSPVPAFLFHPAAFIIIFAAKTAESRKLSANKSNGPFDPSPAAAPRPDKVSRPCSIADPAVLLLTNSGPEFALTASTPNGFGGSIFV